MNMKFLSRKESRFVIPIVMSLGFVFLTVFLLNYQNDRITNLRVYSNDKEILLKWESGCADDIELKVLSSDNEIIDQVVLNTEDAEYSFLAGKHGERYTFSMSAKESDVPENMIYEQSALFLDYEKLPDLPIVNILTQNEEIPAYTVINAPEGYMGQSVVDNEYVSAKITVSENGRNRVLSSGKIRIRGNTSATSFEKKPFKIKFDKPVDLLERENETHADTEWLLLAGEYSFIIESGMRTAEICGMEWQPQFRPVNVMINGQWQGYYYLFENITVGPHRLNLDKTGFLIENDAYWWKEDVYFQTPYQRYDIAYTFKYPQSEAVSADRINEISSYVSAYEIALMEDTPDYAQYIDLESFANWLLVHDILGTWDSGGSNMYLYRQNMLGESKLKAGPVWDVASGFAQKDQWARIHYEELMHYDVLLRKRDFVEMYQQRWEALSDTIVSDIAGYLDTYVQENGEAIQESWQLDAARYNIEVPQFADEAMIVKSWFETRKVWLDEEISKIGSWETDSLSTNNG